MARFSSFVIVLAACQGSSKLDGVREGPTPHTRIQLDGKLTEPAWNAAAIRGVFLGDDGGQARPYSELRILRDETHLFLALYAADQDIRSDDAFDVKLGALHAHLTAAGTATPATVREAVDRDGTLDDPSDEDEEWVVEAAIPLDELGPPPIAIKAVRCDVLKTTERRCGHWTGTIDPKILPVIQ